MILEDVISDLAFNDKAETTYNKIIGFFENDYEEYESDIQGYRVFDLKDYLGYPFYVVLMPKSKSMNGGYGFMNNDSERPWISLNILEADGTFDVSEMKTMKSVIVHELTHHIDRKRFTDTYSEPYKVGSVDKETYYNSPDELNTHFHELLLVLKHSDLSVYGTVQEAVEYFYEDSFGKIPLNDNNVRKIKKRLAQVITHLRGNT